MAPEETDALLVTDINELQEIAFAKETIRKDGRHRLIERWQTRWHGERNGRWTYRLIPELTTWPNRKHGEVSFYLTQALSGRGCFNAYLKHFKRRDEKTCCYCDFPVDNAEHALFVCAKWVVARETADQAVGAELTSDTMVSLMLQSKRTWTLIESFVTLVMKTRELDGHREKMMRRASRNRIEACTLDRKSRADLTAA